KDLPYQGTLQTQCCLCWRMFSSDTACEQAKPYARLPEEKEMGKRGRVAWREECTDPVSLGFNAFERADGVIVWSPESLESRAEKVERMQNARAARSKK